MAKSVGVIIIGWNNKDLLAECFDSIANQSFEGIRTIYVDNKSSDDSVAFTKKQYPWVEVIESTYNSGFTGGNNMAIRELLKDKDIEHIALINSDATLDVDWTKNIVAFARKKPYGAFFQGTTLDYYDHNVVDSTHIYVARNGQATQGGWRTLYKGDSAPAKVFGVNAAACLISRKFIDQQPFEEFFDESFFMYLEDVDVCTRALIMGWENYYIPHAVAYHMGSASSGKNPGFSLYQTYRNNLSMLYKNLPYTMFIKMIPRIVKSDFNTLRGLIGEKKYTAAKSLIKGRFIGVFRFPSYRGKRRMLRRLSTVNDQYLWWLMNNGR